MTTPVSPTNEKEQKKRKRKLRKELLMLLKRLRKACERFHQVEQWTEYAQKALDIADRYADVISDHDRQRLREAVELKDRSLAGVRAACQVLQLEIERLLATLPAAAGGALIGVAVKVLIGVAVVAGVTAGVLNLSQPTTVRLANMNCRPIPIAEGMSPAVVGLAEGAGIYLPDRLEDGEVSEASLPAILPDITLDATQPPTLWLNTTFLSIPLKVSNALDDILVNGESALGEEVTIELNTGEEVTIEVVCR